MSDSRETGVGSHKSHLSGMRGAPATIGLGSARAYRAVVARRVPSVSYLRLKKATWERGQQRRSKKSPSPSWVFEGPPGPMGAGRPE